MPYGDKGREQSDISISEGAPKIASKSPDDMWEGLNSLPHCPQKEPTMLTSHLGPSKPPEMWKQKNYVFYTNHSMGLCYSKPSKLLHPVMVLTISFPITSKLYS